MKSIKSFAFIFFILTLPTQIARHFWPYFSFIYGSRIDYLSPALYLSDLAVIFLCLVEYKKVLKFLSTSLKVIPLFLFLIGINWYFSLEPLVTFYKWVKIIEGILIFGIFSSLKINRKVLGNLLFFILIFLFLHSFYQVLVGHTMGGVLYYLGERSFSLTTPGIAKTALWGREILRPYSIFPHPNALAGFTLILLWLYSWTNPPKIYKTYVFRGISFITILLTASLSALVTFCLSLVLYLAIKTHISSFKTFLRYFLIIGISVSLMTTLVKISYFSTIESSLYERLELMVAAGEAFSEHSLVGIGLGNFVRFLPESHITPLVSWKFQPVHNIYMLILSEGGLLVFLPAFFFLFVTVKRLKSQYLSLALFCILCTGLFDHYWLTLQQTFLLGAIIGGFIFNDATHEY